ncbi:putative diguanylate cyclase (GGDEF domain) with PAS/PAC sensor [Vibrio nigripulchritudo SOn1]|uniref:diguanylate cyclase n=1 Tax=Vibrio nigripulchritudo SOn1 TaxID=1238450 RepID=A0AAV2VMY9_9VIBR|nr:GGDEF domain-containing protein [Vibrio nigripulchritudo]CCO45992.1 putative diguanylate cyclase (GGDEF domain) with PAS/PAC sensor [Vibrio nigripulchritudo SOn1]
MNKALEKLKQVMRWISGDSEDVFNRVHHVFLLLVSIFMVIVGVFNTVAEITPIHFSIILYVVAALMGVMWYYSRFKDRYRPVAVLFATCLMVFVIPMTWFSNSGSYGPTALYCLVTALYTQSVLREMAMLKWPFITFAICLPSILFSVETYYPDLVTHYTSDYARFLDHQFSYFAVMIMLMVMMSGHVYRYRMEAMRAQSYAEKLKHLAERDSLTNLYNHRVILDKARQIKDNAKQASLILCDVDHFKKLNDSYGHLMGDAVLSELARTLEADFLPEGSSVGRYGGEEFLLSLPVGLYEAGDIAERIRVAVLYCSSQSLEITISLGVSQFRDSETVADALKRADQALYKAKQLGRNQVVIAPADNEEDNQTFSPQYTP